MIAPSGPSPHDAASIASVARAAGAMRAGLAVTIESPAGNARVLAVETADDSTLAQFRRASPDALLLLTHARARTLKIRLYTDGVVALDLPNEARAQSLRAIADPTLDLAEPMKGPFHAQREKRPASFSAGIALAKLAGLLPSVVAASTQAKDGDVRVRAADIVQYDAIAIRALTLVSRAHVPLENAENAELAAFRPADGGPEHYAIVIGTPLHDRPVLTRLHSECFTGDLLGSLRCDCGEQLRGAIALIAKSGGGVLLYLAQEGRGIGLINKLRAYRLQDQGFDTMEANERLGFAPDERRFGIAARMLELLGYQSVRLLTNNPDKVKALEGAGITVAERVPHSFPANAHNRAYLATKAQKAGHLF